MGKVIIVDPAGPHTNFHAQFSGELNTYSVNRDI